jgi:hypothetical protein
VIARTPVRVPLGMRGGMRRSVTPRLSREQASGPGLVAALETGQDPPGFSMTPKSFCRLLALATSLTGCAMPPDGLARTEQGDGPEVVFDFDRRPLPELPFPNDIATRPDPTSPTGLRVNASTVASTHFERVARERINTSTGWGIQAPIQVRFDAPIDLDVIYARHRDHRREIGFDYDFADDAVFLIDVTPGSPTYLQPQPLDFGEGNFPQLLRTPHQYWEHDPKTITKALLFETYDEDHNGNGVLDPGEDLDLDGVLDRPNLHPDEDGRPGLDPHRDLVSFWEMETNTLIFKPVVPLRERTTYAVVLTKRLTDESGNPVVSPFAFVNHASQTDHLRPALDALAEYGLGAEDVAFAWSFTTQDVTTDMVDLRNGLYDSGPLSWLAADNPPQLVRLFRMLDLQAPDGTKRDNPYVLPTEVLRPVIAPLAEAAFGGFGVTSVDQLVRTHDFYAYHVSGIIKSPRLLDLQEHGNLDERAWPDLHDPRLRDRVVYDDLQFWCAIPKKQFKADPDAPAPVVLYAHGYTSNKIEQLGLALHAKFGIAGCSIDAVGHGIDVGDDEGLVRSLFALFGMSPAADALLYGRAVDVDGDGRIDVGAEVFTGYVFRTRDNLRQSLLDWLTLVRFIRAFGSETMIDVDGDGVPELLGDFDGDGHIDIGGPDAVFFASGTSLGGLLSSMLSALEPGVVAAAPIAGGAGLIDLTIRSEQGGVVEAVGLRLFGPLILGEPTADGTGMRIYQLFPNGNRDERRDLAVRAEIRPDDVVMVTNLRSGDARCARVMPEEPPPGYEDYRGWRARSNCSSNDPGGLCRVCPEGTGGTYACDLGGTFRVGVPADAGDPLLVEVFEGYEHVHVEGDDRHCWVEEGARLRTSIDQFEFPVEYRLRKWAPGHELVALEDGYGFQRSTPMLRRFTGIASIALEKADPAAFAVRYARDPLEFIEHGRSFQKGPTHVLNVTTVGDANVPVNTGVAISKAAGFVQLSTPDPRYGKTINRVLIDEGVQQGIPWLETHEGWGHVLADVDNLSDSTNTSPMDLDGSNDGMLAPRLHPPLRLFVPTTIADADGVSGLILPLLDEERGAHGFPPPGMTSGPFDVGQYMEHVLGLYFASRGTEIRTEACLAELDACPDIPSPPPRE